MMYFRIWKYHHSIQNEKLPCNALQYSFTINTDVTFTVCIYATNLIYHYGIMVYLLINELDNEERFYIYNTILAGIIPFKPNIEKYFRRIAEDLRRLEDGLRVNEQWATFYVVISMYDKPASWYAQHEISYRVLWLHSMRNWRKIGLVQKW